MIEIDGLKYISEKESSKRYGFSVRWFQQRRLLKKEPKYYKLQGSGKVLYPIIETDKWFKDNLLAY